jgi:copper chaperone NosL
MVRCLDRSKVEPPRPHLRVTVVALMVLIGSGCSASGFTPAPFNPAHDACAFCRMVGSDGRSAGQIVAPGEEPRFFDDIGCLRDYLRRGDVLSSAAAYVVDHRSGVWIDAAQATYTRQAALPTPMGSHLIAHESPASRDADPAAAGGAAAAVSDVFAGLALPRGGRE